MIEIQQGDIVWANLDPVRGSEQAGKRPVVVISGDVMNAVMPIRIVCPLTTHITHRHGRVFIKKNATNGLANDSEVLVFHVRTVSIERCVKTAIGHVTDEQLDNIKEVLGNLMER